MEVLCRINSSAREIAGDAPARYHGIVIPVEATDMHNEFTAVVERDGEWFIAYSPEIPGANGQGKTKQECLKSLSAAIDLILEDRRADALRGIPADATQEIIVVE